MYNCWKRSLSVKIFEVGPRDGLQNEKTILSTALKVQLIERLVQCGIKNIETTSFVSPKWVPQMGDASQVMQQLSKSLDAQYTVLVPNLKGWQEALKSQVSDIAIFTAASESFSKKNINCSIQESLERFKPVMEEAKKHNVKVRGYVSCVIGCPYEGWIDPQKVLLVSKQLLQMGCYEISLGDTIGVGTPGRMKTLLNTLSKDIPVEQLALHCHDTYGQALANILMGLQCGVRVFDSSIAGLGGCPYAEGATGNVATEDVVYLLDGMGYQTGIDLNQLSKVGRFISDQLKKPYGSRAGLATWHRLQKSKL